MPAEDEDDGWDLEAEGKGSSEPTAKMTRCLLLTVAEASNLPLPAAFLRRGREGHLPVGTPAMGMNPYAVVRHAESRRVTAVSFMNAWPKWGAQFEFALQLHDAMEMRPWWERERDIVIEVMNEDRFTADTLIGSASIVPSKVDELLINGVVGAVVQLLLPLKSPVGLPLCGAGAQPALLSVRLEIAEVYAASKDEVKQAAPPQLPMEPRSPEKLKEDSAKFFEKLQQSPGPWSMLKMRISAGVLLDAADCEIVRPVWRGRRGDKKAHVHLDAPDMPHERLEEQNRKSILAGVGVLEHQIEHLEKFLERCVKLDPPRTEPGAKKKVIWRELASLGVDVVSLGVMFGASAQTDETTLQSDAFLGMLAREPAMTRGICDQLARPRVDVDVLLVEAEEAKKAVAILKRYQILPDTYDLRARDDTIWQKASNKMKTSLEKTVAVSAACQADIDPFEGDLFIHYQQLAPGQKLTSQGPAKPEGRSSRPQTHIPAASTRPPSVHEDVRVGQVQGRDLAAFEGPPWPPGRRLGDIEALAPLPDDIKSQVRICTDCVSAAGDTVTQTETVHQFSHTGKSTCPLRPASSALRLMLTTRRTLCWVGLIVCINECGYRGENAGGGVAARCLVYKFTNAAGHHGRLQESTLLVQGLPFGAVARVAPVANLQKQATTLCLGHGFAVRL